MRKYNLLPPQIGIKIIIFDPKLKARLIFQVSMMIWGDWMGLDQVWVE